MSILMEYAIVVYGLFLIDIVQTSCITVLAYNILVVGWGDQTALLDHPWPAATVPLLTGISKF